jgi:hypothetical protein
MNVYGQIRSSGFWGPTIRPTDERLQELFSAALDARTTGLSDLVANSNVLFAELKAQHAVRQEQIDEEGCGSLMCALDRINRGKRRW